MKKQYVMALDQGTTSSRAILFDAAGAQIAMAQKSFAQHYPQPGWVEHDASEIWAGQLGVAVEVLARAGIGAGQLAAIGITNQRETTVLWDRRDSRPLARAIVWQDRRTADHCDRLRAQGLEDELRRRTGLLPDAYFSATKLRWLLDNTPGARALARDGHLAFGTIDSWLIWQLSGGKLHVTDVSNASRTLLFNLHTLQWDDTLLALFDIPASVLPVVQPSSAVYGHTDARLLGASVPIAGAAGDQQAALFGQQCTMPGMVKNTYGTGCFLMMNTGTTPMPSQNRLLSTVAWQIGREVHYALEGSIFMGGSVVKWLRDGLGILRDSAEVGTLAAQVADSDGVYLVPAFAGLGAPHWEPAARGMLVGLTQGSSAAHIARAALDSIALQTLDVVTAMQRDAGLTLRELRVDGGASVNDALMQCQSDLLQCDVVRPRITETTALGAAYLAGLATGFWPDLPTLAQQWQPAHRFSPARSNDSIRPQIAGWHRAVRAAMAWARDEQP